MIVSGLPRSGTSMMMQMLVAGGVPALTDHVRQPDDDNPKGYYEFEPVKRTRLDPSWVDSAAGSVVKMVHLLLYDLPPGHTYRVIFMKRKLEEVLASQSVMLARKGKKGAALSTERLKAVFEQQLEKVGLWLADQPHLEVLDAHHHEVISHPLLQAARINDFLGGKLNVEAAAGVVDPSLYRQRQA